MIYCPVIHVKFRKISGGIYSKELNIDGLNTGEFHEKDAVVTVK